MVFVSEESVGEIPPTDLLTWLFAESPSDPNRPLFVDAKNPDINLSWTQIKDLVGRLAAGLHAHGVRPGDCLCIFSSSNIYYYPSVYAALAVGATFYGGQAWWSEEDLEKYVGQYGGATHVLAEESALPKAAAAMKACGLDISRIIVFNDPDAAKTHEFDGTSLTTWSSLLDHGERPWMKINAIDDAQNQVAMHLCTSRTSSETPKVARLSHYAAIAHIFQWCQSFQAHAFDLKALQFLPLDALSGHAFLSTAIKLGFPVYILRYSIPDIAKALAAVQPSLLMTDPHTMMQVIRAVPEGSDALRCLRDVRLVGMAFPANARQTAKQVLHPECLMSRPYGLTETGSIAAALYEQREQNDPESVGFTYPGTEVKLIDEDGSEITSRGDPGEVLVRSPAMFSGYVNNSSATQDAFNDGWFVTGDVGYISSQNQQWYLIGRKTTLFKIAGQYVVPEEIESLLATHEEVADAAVAPLPVPGQKDPLIRALIVSRSPGKLSEEDVLAFGRSKLPPQKMINGGVYFTDSIPRGGLRKVLRWQLPQLFQQSIAAGKAETSVGLSNSASVVSPVT